LEVQVRKNDVVKAMRILKKKLEREGVMQELRQREHYEKPSDKKRREKKANINRSKKAIREQQRDEDKPRNY
jgi:small subunit ribosomal protein S21